VWGLDGIDLHFLPSQEVKESLIGKNKFSKQNMFVTGIPVHGEITDNSRIRKNSVRPKILVSGGNSGLGRIQKMSDELKKSTHLDFLVLCGKNKKLYNDILSWNLDHVTPIPYLSSRSEMNAIYEEVDAIITKPGGVTVSEALHKSLPIFVHSALPGQEEINLKYLKNKGLIFNLDLKKSIEQQLTSVLNDKVQIDRWKKSLISYKKGLELQNPEKMTDVIMSLLNYKLKLSSRA
jgi:UDP-N-acetylglucosamine:LPS N-acetylglucosamine transferase